MRVCERVVNASCCGVQPSIAELDGGCWKRTSTLDIGEAGLGNVTPEKQAWTQWTEQFDGTPFTDLLIRCVVFTAVLCAVVLCSTPPLSSSSKCTV